MRFGVAHQVSAVYALLLNVGLIAPTLSQEPEWRRVYPSASPTPRIQAKMAYDGARNVVVLFGGWQGVDRYNQGPESDETWLWNGKDWTRLNPAVRPAARHGHAMAYDSIRQEVVLFGGVDEATGQIFGDTWVWNGSSWIQKHPLHSPSPRFFHSMAFDEARGTVVLFGGAPMWSGGPNETWLWNGDDWTRVYPINSPPLRWAAAMAYDAARGITLLFGGWGGGSGLNDTWSWDGTNWSLLVVPTSPPLRWQHAMAYDAERKKVVMFAGLTPPAFPADTWVWNGSDWQAAPTPPELTLRVNYALSYDGRGKQILMFGGDTNTSEGNFSFLNETWVRGAVESPCGTTEAIPFGTIDGKPACWLVRDEQGPPSEPGPNYWRKSQVALDANGILHFTVSPRDGNWASAEVYSSSELGYGQYTFEVASALNFQHPNLVLGLFAYTDQDNGSLCKPNEIDIEFSRWGMSFLPSSYAYRKYTVAPNCGIPRESSSYLPVMQSHTPDSIHAFTWRPDSIVFESTTSPVLLPNRRVCMAPRRSSCPADSVWTWVIAIPVPNKHRAHINLWMFGGHTAPREDDSSMTVSVKSFAFQSLK